MLGYMTYFSKNCETAWSSTDGAEATGTDLAHGYGLERLKLDISTVERSDGSLDFEIPFELRETLEASEVWLDVVVALDSGKLGVEARRRTAFRDTLSFSYRNIRDVSSR